MAYERVHKSFGQSSNKKKHSPIVPSLIDQQTQADSQLSPKAKLSRIPSKEEREAIKRKVFETIHRTGENQAKREGLYSPTDLLVQKALESSSVLGTGIQAKLTIGVPGDKYEQEADRVASQVVNEINAPVAQQKSQNLQRETILEEEEKLQMKPILQLQSGVGSLAISHELESSIQQARSGGQPLAEQVRKPMEQAFGADFSGVKVHTDGQSDQLNQSIQAKAFTTGQDVFFRSGEYNPESRGGQELIAHELTHVVQQNSNVVMRMMGSATLPPPPPPLPKDGKIPKQKIPSSATAGGQFLSSGYKRINPLLSALYKLGIKADPKQSESLVTRVQNRKVEILKVWKAEAESMKPSDTENIKTWDDKDLTITVENIQAINKEWAGYEKPEVEKVYRGDSVTLYKVFKQLEPETLKLEDGKHTYTDTITWPGLMSTTIGDPKTHNFINGKTIVWDLDVRNNHNGRVIGNENPSEAEVTFPVGTTIKVNELIVRRQNKDLEASTYGDSAELIVKGTIV
ncbi:MAG: DUF4157 domain-containing protein [Rhizonema sp. PD37]|nr:DUF4157 domain-containing protein [Rhizonema sp. PD37]